MYEPLAAECPSVCISSAAGAKLFGEYSIPPVDFLLFSFSRPLLSRRSENLDVPTEGMDLEVDRLSRREVLAST